MGWGKREFADMGRDPQISCFSQSLPAASGNVTSLVCDATLPHVSGKDVFLLLSSNTDFHIAEFSFK